MKQETLLVQIQASYDNYFNELFSKALNDSNGNFETFIDNISEDIPLNTTKTKLSEKFIQKNLQKSDLITAGSLVYSLELGQFAFVYTIKVANALVEGSISNMPNFKENIQEVKSSVSKAQEAADMKMPPADLNVSDLFCFAFTAGSTTSSAAMSARTSGLIELYILLKTGDYEFKHSYPVIDLFVEETYVSVANAVLKSCKGTKKYTKGQLRSIANGNIISVIKDSLKNKNLKEALIEYNKESILQPVFDRYEKLINSLAENIKEDK